jgi:hypothetical protein
MAILFWRGVMFVANYRLSQLLFAGLLACVGGAAGAAQKVSINVGKLLHAC